MTSAAEREVIELFERLRTAMINNDLAPLEAHVAPDYQGCDAGGRVHGRETYLEAYGPGGVELEVFEVHDLHTKAWADTVLVTGRARLQGRYGEYDFAHDLRFLDVYARRNGEWQLVGSHVCDIAAD